MVLFRIAKTDTKYQFSIMYRDENGDVEDKLYMFFKEYFDTLPFDGTYHEIPKEDFDEVVKWSKGFVDLVAYSGRNDYTIEFHEVRGTEGLKEATYNIAGLEIKVAVASGAANAKLVMDKIAKGEADWTFVEIMGCPGGCVNGGGQPIQPGHVRNFTDLKALRAKALYEDDLDLEYRKSHDNPEIKAIYDEYLGEPGSHLAHELLHTSYVERKKN